MNRLTGVPRLQHGIRPMSRTWAPNANEDSISVRTDAVLVRARAKYPEGTLILVVRMPEADNRLNEAATS